MDISDKLFLWLKEKIDDFRDNEVDAGEESTLVQSPPIQLEQSEINDLKKRRIKIKSTKLTLFSPPEVEKSILEFLLDQETNQTDDNNTSQNDSTFMIAESSTKNKSTSWKLENVKFIKSVLQKLLKQPADKPPAEHQHGDLSKFKYLSQASIDECDIPHCVSIINSRGQAGFLDIAPSLLTFNPVNIVTFRLDEDLNSQPTLSTRRDSMKCHMTQKQLFQSLIPSLVALKTLEETDEDDEESCQSSQEQETSDSKQEKRTKWQPSYIIDEDNTLTDPVFCIFGSKSDPNSKFVPPSLNDVVGCVSDNIIFHKKEIIPCTSLDKDMKDNIRSALSKYGVVAEVPIQWLLLQLKLEKYRKDMPKNDTYLPILQYQACLDFGKEYFMDEDDVEQALAYFHDMSIFLYFQEKLPEVVFLQPQPIFDKLVEIMKCGETAEKQKDVKDIKNGIYNKSLFKRLSAFPNYFQKQRFFALMEKVYVIAPLGNGGQKFFPNVLTPMPPNYPHDENFKKIEPLVIGFTDESGEDTFLPSLFTGLIFKLIADKNDLKFDLNTASGCPQYRNAICLTCKFAGGAVLLINSGSCLEVYYSGANTKPCNVICTTIHTKIKAIVKENGWRETLTQLQNYFFCSVPDCPDKKKKTNSSGADQIQPPKPHLCRISDDLSTLTCCKSGTATCDAKSRQKQWLGGESISGKDKPNIDKLYTILIQGDNGIARKWEEIAVGLKISTDPREQIKKDLSSDVVKLKKVLEVWCDNHKSKEEFTWNFIIAVLRTLHLNSKAQEIEDSIIS